MSGHTIIHRPKSETEEWKADGACLTPAARGVEFFPGQGEPTNPAKRICATCTVRRECLEYALTEPKERWGIWGGTSGNDRRSLTLAKVVANLDADADDVAPIIDALAPRDCEALYPIR